MSKKKRKPRNDLVDSFSHILQARLDLSGELLDEVVADLVEAVRDVDETVQVFRSEQLIKFLKDHVPEKSAQEFLEYISEFSVLDDAL